MIVRLKPYLEPKIWGSKKLKERYLYEDDIPIGEAWGISMIQHKESIILDGDYQGMPFSILFREKPELFGGLTGKFPLLIKIIDAHDDLSIQVHPKEGENEKNESWIILEATKSAKIILGHKANSIEEFQKALKQKKLSNILVDVVVKKDDEYYINGGKLHGIGKGIELLEIQQASDTTYRVYDYNRLTNDVARTLHLTEAFEVMSYPDKKIKREIKPHYFNAKKIVCDGELSLISDQFGDYLYIVNGRGFIGGKEVKTYDFVFISSKEEYVVKGNLEIIKSNVIKGLTS